VTARNEGLMDFVQRRISGRDRKRSQTPGPSPASATAAYSAIEEQAEQEVLDKVRALSDPVMDDFELMRRQRGDEQAKYRLKDKSSMFRGKSVRGHHKDDAPPDDRRPPGTQPAKWLSLPQAGLYLR
jgi:hypothetical protein